MKWALWGKKAFAISMIIVLVCSYFTGYPAKVAAAETTKVVLAGNLQTKLGNTKDWDEKSTVTQMTYLDNGTYTFTGTLPAGTYEYKVTLNDAWTDNFGIASYTNPNGAQKGGNIVLTLAEDTAVTFYYNDITKKIADSTYYHPVSPRLTGTLQTELGEAADSSPQTAQTILADTNFDNVYERKVNLPEGDYTYQIYIPGTASAEEQLYPEQAEALSLPQDLAVTFSYSAADHGVKADFTVPVPKPEPGEVIPVPEGHIRIHYQREDGNYKNQGVWIWEGVPAETTGWPYGAIPIPEGQTDSYGAYIDIQLKENAKNISFLIVNMVTEEKDGGNKLYTIGTPQTNEVWIKTGSDKVSPYEPVELPADTVRIHYNRADGDESSYGVWHWEDVARPSETVGKWPEAATAFPEGQVDSYGAYVDIPLTEQAKKIGFVIVNRSTGEKDGENKTFSLLDRYNQLWITEGKDTVYVSSFGELPVSLASAEVVSATELLLGFTLTDGLDAATLQNGITVLDSDNSVIPVKSAAILNGIQVKVTTEAFNLDKTPLSVTYSGRTVSAAGGWRMIDSLYNYTGDDLGATYNSADHTATLKLWAPLAGSVVANLYDKDDAAVHVGQISLSRGEQGVWSATLKPSDLKEVPGADDVRGYYYQYEVTNNGETKPVLDPYAKSMAMFTVNSAGQAGADGDTVGKAAIVDLSATNPDSFTAADIDGYEKREDAVIYEVHVRDFTSDPSIESTLDGERWGSYAAFAKKLDYIKSLGVTHIQLLPVMSWYYGDETKMGEREGGYSAQNNEYNWGYDPHSYFSPDGAYSENPADPELRIKELKGLIDAVHEAGMGVILDVVYTHMAKKDFLNDIVPNYYFFQDATGNFVGGFGNNLATSHLMAEKLMVDSVKYWFNEYRIDGMRFDMMGDATQDAVQAAYNAAAEINPDALFLGEGWETFSGYASDPALTGKGADQNWMNKTDDVGVFSDEFRNELKSGFGNEGQPRFLTGGARQISYMLDLIKAQPSNVPADDPGDIISYIEAHDNLTLHDVIAQSIKKDPAIEANELEIQQRIRLGNLLVMTSQGTPFIQAGQEYGRTKEWKAEGVPEQKATEMFDESGQSFGYFIHDSYDSSDAVNMFDWSKVTDTAKYPVQNLTKDYTAGLIELRKSTDAFRLGDQRLTDTNVTLVEAPEVKESDLLLGYKNKATDGTGLYYVFVNADGVSRTLSLSEDLTGGTVLVDSDEAGIQAIPAADQTGFTLTDKAITLDPLTAVVIQVDAEAAVLTSLETDSAGYDLELGKTHQMKVSALYDDGSRRTVTGSASYVSDKPEVAAVTNKGAVKAVSSGSANITVSYGGKTVTVPVKVKRPVLDNKRYVEFTYIRPDKDYTDWNMWVWESGASDGQVDLDTAEGGKVTVLVEVGKDITRMGFVLRKGTDWLTGKQDIQNDRYIPLPAGESYIKVTVTSMVQELDVTPVITGPVLENGTVQFLYRDPELFRLGDVSPITDIKVKVNGTEYAMTYDPENEWFSYTLTGLTNGTYEYTFVVTKDGETREITDPKNTVDGKSSVYYRNPKVTLTASVSPAAITSDENAVVEVQAVSDEEVTYRAGYLDLSELGGPSAVPLDTELLKQTVAVRDNVPAGIKTIPVTLVDQYGNRHQQQATIQVKARTYTGDALDFDWDEARIYFALTDRFKDGDASNNENVDKDHLEAYHGGDFQGMIDSLDYLKELGINTLWITPVVDNIDFNQGASFGKQYAYHGYWAKDFTQLDEHLGDMETFKELIEKAHDRGIKIMVDVVLNHAGYGLKESDTASGVTAEDKARFAGMLRTDGVDTDKDVIKGELSGLPDFKTEDPAVREKIIAWQTGWLENARTDRGDTIDYFRVDTVKHVESTTWKAFKNALTEIAPKFKMVGEYFGGTIDNNGGYLQSGQMDSLLDFGFKEQAKAFVGGSIEAVDGYLQEREAKIDNTKMMAQFLSSHDEDGFLTSEAVNGDKGKLKAAAALQITAKGQPVIYYGEELGRSGKNAGDMSKGELSENRADMPWDQLEAEADLHEHYQKLLSIRAKYSKLYSKGERTKLAGSDETGYLAFDKAYLGAHIVTVINTNAEKVNAAIPVPFAANSAVKDEYSGKQYRVAADGTVAFELPGRDEGGTVILTAVPYDGGTPAPAPAPTPAPTAPAAAQLVGKDILSAVKDGKVTVKVETGKHAVQLPVDAAAVMGASDLELQMNGLTVTLPNAVLAALQKSLTAAQADGASITFAAAPLEEAAAKALLQKLNSSSTQVNAVSDIYDFRLQMMLKDGSAVPATAFDEPVTLAFQVSGSPDSDLLGVFHLDAGGELDYAGGTLHDKTVTAQVTHFSQYAALEVKKTFKDVPAAHWAFQAIQSLSAKQIVNGVSQDAFNPGGKVTRAEFTALLVRALGLQGTGQGAFADVAAGAWYAADVNTAVSLGIVNGRGEGRFAPNSTVTREEMAAMLIRALQVKEGRELTAAASASFTDAADISAWAASYVNAASDLNLIQGREGGGFAPKAAMTRAESAQVIYRLLGL
ncbi:pullulanase [Paenibacillus tengchongensis]|uniref:pullulanase n=1 Tax=Paenibacillus tengchongensis TaxID=2608684 RepID=UPI00124EC417|nr:pullulanase [Paenibacillus tengchongensis]